MDLFGEDVFRPFFVRWGVCRSVGQWHRTVGEGRHRRFGGCGLGIDLLCSEDLNFSIRTFAKDGALDDLAVCFATQDLAIEADVRVEEGFWRDILQDMNLVSIVEENFWCAVGNKPSEAVCAENGAAFGVFDADIELGAVW